MTIFYLDYVNGNDSNDGSSWANAWKTITNGATAARIAPGDTIRIAKSPDPTSLGQTATWTNLGKYITLTTAVTENISTCEANWTAGTNVTSANTNTTYYKEGSSSIAIITNSSHNAAGILAKYNLASPIDLSNYQQVSFWFRNQTSALANAGDLKLKLYSDAACTIEVESFNIPAIPSTARFLPITVNKGSALSSSVQGVALYANGATASKTFYIDNIIACKASSYADSLTLQSLVSKNTGDEGWYGIQSINGTTVYLDADTNATPATTRGYSGVTETVTTYKRETIKTAMSNGSLTLVQEIKDSGTSGNLINFLGGWNTVTTTQDGETFFDGLNGYGYGLTINSNISYICLGKLSFFRYDSGIRTSNFGSETTIGSIIDIYNASNNTSYGLYFNSITKYSFSISNINNNSYGLYFSGLTVNNYLYNGGGSNVATIINANNNSSYGIYNANLENTILITTYTNNNGNSGIYLNGCNNCVINAMNSNYNNNYGFLLANSLNNKMYNFITTGNGISSTYFNRGTNYLYNCSMQDSLEVIGFGYYAEGVVYSHRNDQTENNYWVYGDKYNINYQTSVKDGDALGSWRISPTNTIRNSLYPIKFKIATIACNANSQVTVTARMRRSSQDIKQSLVCPANQIQGVTSDVITAMTAANDTWETVTIQFTPTEKGGVEIYSYIYTTGSVADYAYVCNVTASQV